MIHVDGTVGLAARAPDGSIVTDLLKMPRAGGSARVPVLRGIVALGAAIRLSLAALLWSARVQNRDAARFERPAVRRALLVGVVVAALVFGVAPAVVAHRLVAQIGPWTWLAEFIVRLAFLIIYLAAVGRLAHIAEVFEYHGAEHAAVACFEALGHATTEAAARYSPRHPRCGTSLILWILFAASLLTLYWEGCHSRSPRSVGQFCWLSLLVSGMSGYGLLPGCRLGLSRAWPPPQAGHFNG